MISLSTHVLDTAAGRPVAGVRVELLLAGDMVAAAETDEDGRVGELATGLEAGTYSLVFHPRSPFLRRVAVDIELDTGHYHVPLLVAPYGCTTYRGS